MPFILGKIQKPQLYPAMPQNSNGGEYSKTDITYVGSDGKTYTTQVSDGTKD